MIPPDARGYFITGSDTDVGKTYIACQLIAQLAARGFRLETRKPAESGCAPGADGELLTQDAAALCAANAGRESIERIVAYRLRAALAPHRAARLENRRLWLRDLIAACARDDPASLLLVEGAGGFLSPLAEDALNADLAVALGLPVVVVVDDRVGAVNQALMTIEAVAGRALEVAAIVLNQVQPRATQGMDNAADLGAHCRQAIFSCAYGRELPPVFG